MNRRSLLAAAAAAPVGASASLASGFDFGRSVDVPSRSEMIAHHLAELFRLLGETVPEGAALDNAIVRLVKGDEPFIHMTAVRPEWTGPRRPFYSFCTLDGEWKFTKGKTP